MDLYTAVLEIDKIVGKTTNKNTKSNLLNEIASQIATKNSVDNVFINEIEMVIKKYLQKLDEKSIIDLWSKTDMGVISLENDANFEITSENAILDLEMELFSEYSTYLWSKYGDKDKPRQGGASASSYQAWNDIEDEFNEYSGGDDYEDFDENEW